MSDENRDLLALGLTEASLPERITALELLSLFEEIEGFYPASVRMMSSSASDLEKLPENSKLADSLWRISAEEVIGFGIRGKNGHLSETFITWFEQHCLFDALAGNRRFLAPHTRPFGYEDLVESSASTTGPKETAQQLQTKLAMAAIDALNPQNGRSANDIYPEFVRKAVELANTEAWNQIQNIEAWAIEGSGHLMISFITRGEAKQVLKMIQPRRFGELLRRWRNHKELS